MSEITRVGVDLVRILVTVTDRSGDRDRFAAVWRCAAKL